MPAPDTCLNHVLMRIRHAVNMVVREDILEDSVQRQSSMRWVYLAIGWLAVAIGTVGFALPILPSTVFFLIALWAFSRGSPRFENWLLNHRLFGPTLQAWRHHRVIPAKAKLLAVACMSASLLFIIFVVADGWMLPSAVALSMVVAVAVIFRYPSQIPAS
jgi:uncharacterized protein